MKKILLLLAFVMAGCVTIQPPAIETSEVDTRARALEPFLIELRRDIHRHPELAGQEHRTADIVARHLREYGLEVRTGVGGTGVVGILYGSRPGPVVAYRADMDAYPGDEPDREVRSTVPGVHHVCGHDLHVAIGIGVAQVLASMRDELTGTVLFLFQPAEETLEGAAAMIADGAIDDPRPSAIFALHTFPFPVGTIAHGAAFSGRDEASIELRASPETIARLETALQGLGDVPMPESLADFDTLLADLQRSGEPLDESVFATVWSTAEGDRTTVSVVLKASHDDMYASLRDRIGAIANEIAGAGNYELRFKGAWFPRMSSNPTESRAAAVTLSRVLGAENVLAMKAVVPIAGEDFALFLERIPGAMFFLGVANRERGIVGIPHLSSFDADEEALVVGTRAMSAVILDRLRQ